MVSGSKGGMEVGRQSREVDAGRWSIGSGNNKVKTCKVEEVK